MIKLLNSLRQKKQRQKYHLFVAEGDKCITTMLDHRAYDVHRLFAISSWFENHDTRVSTDKAQICTKEELKKLSALKSTPDVIAVFEMNEPDISILDNCHSAIYLDEIQDPGNVGTIIRLADWYGIDTVIRSPDSADFYNAKVVQSTMGSLGHVRLLTLPQDDISEQLSEWSIIGASMTSSPSSTALTGKRCLVLGNEGRGHSATTTSAFTHTIHIPGHPNRKADSLNAGVSAGILMQHLWGEDL